MTTDGKGTEQLQALGAFIRSQRLQARMSLRDLAAKANVSNPYISQIERGLHEPSVRVLRSIAQALGMSADVLLAQLGLHRPEGQAGEGPIAGPSAEAAIAADPALTPEQRDSLLAVYRSFVAANARP
ncbi:MAG: helix-turn-helix domain-containing protein [Acidimicrobiales bacterium]|nr:helix-turn-helix domain-containing protein [Acidimicrobiales bacterium]